MSKRIISFSLLFISSAGFISVMTPAAAENVEQEEYLSQDAEDLQQPQPANRCSSDRISRSITEEERRPVRRRGKRRLNESGLKRRYGSDFGASGTPNIPGAANAPVAPGAENTPNIPGAGSIR